MIRRPPRSTLDRSSAASDVYKRQVMENDLGAAGAAVDISFDMLRSGAHYAKVFKRPNVPLRVCCDAVSYTHLRAHETVLDIVCRLLLEKKKKSVS